MGLGVKCSKEVATAIRGAIILAKLSVIPVRRGYWGNKIGKPHTVPCKVRTKKYRIKCGDTLWYSEGNLTVEHQFSSFKLFREHIDLVVECQAPNRGLVFNPASAYDGTVLC